MNTLVERYFESLVGKQALVLGIGVSNRPLIRMLLEHGISVTACDKTPYNQLDQEILELERFGVKLQVGENYLSDLSADIVFRTPGMHPANPAIAQLCADGAVLTSEMEVFFEVCPCPIIGVTGSDGKTTTTTLIGEILTRAGKRVWVGGNIGQPLLPLAAQMRSEDVAVVELSSFQLMTMRQSPSVAVVTNLAPNHLDVHKNMAEYIAAKENIYLHQAAGNRLVLNADNEITAGFAAKAKGHITFFGRKTKQACDAIYKDGRIVFRGREVMNTSDILLPGEHNIENYMAAICAVEGFASDDAIRYVARNFKGVEHRIELVREINGVKFYNDSIASSPTRTTAGLRSFDREVILIAGGYDKHIPFDALGDEIVAHVKRLVLCGATADKIRTAVLSAKEYRPGTPEIVIVNTLEEAVRDAHIHSASGDVVLLSPACAAFDQFKNFMMRGKRFKEIVAAL